ncbi:unnamed protein product [Rodentolepis nana]|uniref:MFS domain-containing protein n=1 Tax=Rodentolepis nana TaxID=102285 RepID=A0A0R3TMA4_RODNA|nr:unnamed protein product [Rodentolepis nana]
MTPYVISHLHERLDSDVNYSFGIWISAGSISFYASSMPISGLLAQKVDILKLVAIASFLNSLSHFASAFALTQHKVLFFFTYSVLTGISMGLAFGIILQTSLAWFPRRKGLVVGICTVASGLGSTLLAPFQTLYINPNNLSPNSSTSMFEDSEILNRTPQSLQVTGIVVTILAAIGISLFRLRQVESSNEAKNNVDDVLEDNPGYNDLKEIEGLTLGEALRVPNFYLFSAIVFSSYFSVSVLMANVKTVAQTAIRDDRFLMIACTLAEVLNIISRFFWGLVSDWLSFKVHCYKMGILLMQIYDYKRFNAWAGGNANTAEIKLYLINEEIAATIPLIINCIVYGTILITFPYIVWLPDVNRACFAIWTMLLFHCLAGVSVLISFGAAASFGAKNVASIFGMIFAASVPSSIICSLILYFIDVSKVIKEVFLAAGLASCCGE